MVPNVKLRAAAKLIEKGKIDAERVQLQAEKIDLLNQRISILEDIIETHTEKDSAQAKVTRTYEEELKTTRAQRDLAVQEMKDQNKKYRRQKRKTVIAAVGAAGITAALFIYLK